MMIRTQVSFTGSEYKMAKEEAKHLGISIAELFRRALRLILPVKGNKPWMRFGGLVESGNKKSSQEIDELIYGQKD